ncbi:MAG: inositol monophosphatase family protein [Patescibacteria group bacterium]
MEKKYLSKYLLPVKNFVQKVGKLQRDKFYLDREINLSTSKDVHLKIDLESEEKIKKYLTDAFPEIGFLGEESGRNDAKKSYWVVDPLDGTVNYYFYNPLFAISIALVENQDIVFAIIYAPMTGEFFWAGKNEGAFFQGELVKNKQSKYSKVVIGGYNNQKRCEHASNFSLPGNQILNKIEMGCASLELAYVGTGRITSYILEKTRLWDIAAGVLFVKESGNVVTNWDGQKWTIKDKYLLASCNEKIHKKILKKISFSKEQL